MLIYCTHLQRWRGWFFDHCCGD